MVHLITETYLPALSSSREETFNFLQSVREISEGKMTLEKEFAMSTKQVVEMYE